MSTASSLERVSPLAIVAVFEYQIMKNNGTKSAPLFTVSSAHKSACSNKLYKYVSNMKRERSVVATTSVHVANSQSFAFTDCLFDRP